MKDKDNTFHDLPPAEQKLFNEKIMILLDKLNEGKKTHKVNLTKEQISILTIFARIEPRELSKYLEMVWDIAIFHAEKSYRHSPKERTAMYFTKDLYKRLSKLKS